MKMRIGYPFSLINFIGWFNADICKTNYEEIVSDFQYGSQLQGKHIFSY